MKVLVVEDDAKIARFIRNGLEAEGDVVDVSADGEDGSTRALSGQYDLILLDIMLPRLDGFELLRRLRSADSLTPVIAVTARKDVEDRVEGLDLGADDYLVKPFSFVELRARIRALFRRTAGLGDRVLNVGALSLDRAQRKLHVGGKAVELSTREYQLLEFFIRNQGEPLTRAMIADRVWGYQFDTGTNVIDVYVNYVRKKLRRLGLDPIRTLRGIGYSFEPDACQLTGLEGTS